MDTFVVSRSSEGESADEASIIDELHEHEGEEKAAAAEYNDDEEHPSLTYASDDNMVCDEFDGWTEANSRLRRASAT